MHLLKKLQQQSLQLEIFLSEIEILNRLNKVDQKVKGVKRTLSDGPWEILLHVVIRLQQK